MITMCFVCALVCTFTYSSVILPECPYLQHSLQVLHDNASSVELAEMMQEAAITAQLYHDNVRPTLHACNASCPVPRCMHAAYHVPSHVVCPGVRYPICWACCSLQLLWNPVGVTSSCQRHDNIMHRCGIVTMQRCGIVTTLDCLCDGADRWLASSAW
eukprot:m.1508009 g.1508009  ORF g.1508009 m.1508009 type:complete len:158 (-) comp25209_c0_seq139:3462-3935(-)